MENYPYNYTNSNDYLSKSIFEAEAVGKKFMANVFLLMGLGLVLTAIAAYYTASTPALLESMINETETTKSLSMLGWIIMLAPLAFVLVISFGVNKLSYSALVALFTVYSLVMGMSLSFIFLMYTMSSIATTFLVSAGMFGVMALVGYTTDTDLTKMGSILLMALFGLIIASLVNIFLGSSMLDWIISFVGVLLFAGLTAWDVQKMKNMSLSEYAGTATGKKLSLIGALNLYLDFINLFLFLLRFFGRRN